MASADKRGWGHPGAPGSAQDRSYQRNHLVTITLACGVKLRVRREVSHLFKGFFDELEAETGYSLADRGQPDDWGFNNRDIRDRPGVKSNHAWGLAIDGNAEENPMQSPLRTDMPVAVVRRLAARWGLRWGGDYSGRKDSMHFEFLGTPADVARYPLGTTPTTPAPAAPASPSEEDDMRPVILTAGGPNWLVLSTGAGLVRVLMTDGNDARNYPEGYGPVVEVAVADLDKIPAARDA